MPYREPTGLEQATKRGFRAIDGNRKLEEIASAAGLGCEDTKRILQSLAEIGAVVGGGN